MAEKSHGGEKSRGKRKVARPLEPKKALHVTFRSARARGKWSFLRHRDAVANSLEQASRFGVKVYRCENVGNHLHIVLKGKSRSAIQNFLRVFPQRLVFRVTGARKGAPIGRFWDSLVFTRIVEWGRDWRNLHNYLEKNRFESLGIPRDVVDLWWTFDAEQA